MLLRVGQLRRLADEAHDLALGIALRLVRDGFVRRVRHHAQELVPRGLGLRELTLEPLQVGLDLFQLLDLLRRRFAFQLLPAPQLVHLRDELTPALVRRQ